MKKAKAKAPVASMAMDPAAVRAMQELRRSGAAGTHGDRRLKRQRTRAALRRAAVREW
jgi:hypothetical protein